MRRMERAKPSSKVKLPLLLWVGYGSEVTDEAFVPYVLHSTLECMDGQRDF